MFATIRKHQTWLWAFIIAAVIVSFVIYFTPTVRAPDRSGLRRSKFGSIHGRPITHKEFSQAYLETQLGFFLRHGVWPGTAEARQTGFSVERETRNRLVLLDRVQELRIEPDESAVASWILENLMGGNSSQAGRARYETLLRTLQRYHVSEADLHRFIRHQIAIDHLANLAGITGRLIPPRAAEDRLRESLEQIEAEVAFFSTTNYLLSVQMDPAKIAQYYTNRQSVYRIPERVQVLYVRFPMTNYIAEAEAELAKQTNFAAQVDQIYLGSNPASFRDTNGQTLSPEAAKARIRESLRDQQAIVEARKAAANFARELEGLRPLTVEKFTNFATQKGLPVFETQPFSELDGPSELNVQQNFVDVAFKLTAEEPVAIAPIRSGDTVYIIALKQRFPSELPSLESIRAKVEQDFRRDEAMRLTREAATNFLATLTNSLAQGKDFEAICSEHSVTHIKLPAFSLATQPGSDWDRRVDLGQVKSAVTGLGMGKASRVVPTRDGAFVLYVRSRKPASDEEIRKDLPNVLAKMRESEE
ncbi:MAG: SurA N-terminal domain-containing protein, partial [Verrucomicrobiae bacterium]|nr:SurA N-terminal domain-containing protein [Verrucomicrobiae bacterium]